MARHRKDNPRRPPRQWKSAEIAVLITALSALLTSLAALLNALN